MQSKKIRKATIGAFCMAIILFTFYSCSNKISFTNSQIVPAATGHVKIKKDKNENYAIEVSIFNLAEVEKLQGNNETYVVWMTSNVDNPKNIGQITSGTKRFSKKLSASFNTVSSSKPTKIFVTAEQNGSVQFPGYLVVLTTETL